MNIDAIMYVGLALLIAHILNYQSDKGIYKAISQLTFPDELKQNLRLRTPADLPGLLTQEVYSRSLSAFINISFFFKYFSVPLFCISAVTYFAGLISLAIERFQGDFIITVENVSTLWSSNIFFGIGMVGIFVHILGLFILKVPALIERLPGFEDANSISIVIGRAKKKSEP